MKALLISCFDFHNDLRFKYVEKILTEKGFLVKKVFSDFNHLEKSKVFSDVPNSIRIQVPEYQKNVSFKRIYSHIIFSAKLKGVLEKESPNLIFADIPPNTIAMTVAKYKKKYKECKVIFDVFDLWPESFSGSKLLTVPFWFWKKIRSYALPKADYVILECDYYKQFLNQYLCAGRHSTLYLCKTPLEERVEFSHSKELTFCYLGSINRIINIPAIIKLLSQIKSSRKVKLFIVGDGERREDFLVQLKESQIDFEYLGFIFGEDEKNKILSKCHFGLNMYNDNVIVGLTMKSLDYFRVGLPTINMNIYDTEKLVEEYQSGFSINNENWDEGIKTISSVDEKKWQSLHEYTVEMFKEQFAHEVFNKKFKEILDQVVR